MLRTYHLAVLGFGVGLVVASSNVEALAQCSRGGGGSTGSQSIASGPLAFTSMSTGGVQKGSIASPILTMRNSTSQTQRELLALSQQQTRKRVQRQQSLLAVRRENAEATRLKR